MTTLTTATTLKTPVTLTTLTTSTTITTLQPSQPSQPSQSSQPSLALIALLLFFFNGLSHKKGEFLPVDLELLLEEQSHSICDRSFGCIQQFFNSQEEKETPQNNLDWIRDYKSFLRMKYVARRRHRKTKLRGEEDCVYKLWLWRNWRSGGAIKQTH